MCFRAMTHRLRSSSNRTFEVLKATFDSSTLPWGIASNRTFEVLKGILVLEEHLEREPSNRTFEVLKVISAEKSGMQRSFPLIAPSRY